MGQAKNRGDFIQRKALALIKNSADDIAQRNRLAEERSALNKWYLENPEQYKRQKQLKEKAIQIVAMAAMMGAVYV